LKRYSLEDCLREGKLRRIPPSRQGAEGSMRAAQMWLEEAERSLKAGASSSSVLASYLSMFHSARAILYLDGYREKSHYCVARHLERHVAAGRLEARWVDLLDHYREQRHESQYRFNFVITAAEAEASLASSREFVDRMAALKETITGPRDQGTTGKAG
jgi:uncharacterized protein (UPF0332 family)